MAELLTAAQMRAIEQAAIESGAVTGLELMERAGRGVVEAVLNEWPDLAATSHRAVVLCGPGNNGGDGFVVARLLRQSGWEVEVFLYGDPDKLPGDARVNYERWVELGAVKPIEAYLFSTGWKCDVLVDALFGTGLKRGLRPLGELFWNMEDMVNCFPVEPGHQRGRPAIVAVDVPSGICADSGRDFPNEDEHWRFAAAAHLTVTFHSKKIGHHLAEGPAHAGKVVVKDIGLPVSKPCPRESWRETVRILAAPHGGWIKKDIEDHKYTHGHALILSGPSGQTGAARLAARGALRIGAGLVTIGAPDDARVEIAAQTTAIMQRQVDGAGELEALLDDPRIKALCLGPGLGVDRARELLPVAVRAKHAPYAVLDADALTAFADNPQALFDLCADARVVLTPHGGEFARLFPDISEKLTAAPTKGPAFSKVDATREAAKRANAVVLFKGPDTVIADPTGRASVHSAHYDRAAPWLATAGSGDVLAGFIAGLLARGIHPMPAAEAAVWLHVDCALNFGPGLIAEDLPERLPKVLRKLGL
ncbi:MAG: NAD(P)H-hydrate dehydratase [Brevirhabdus sp.]